MNFSEINIELTFSHNNYKTTAKKNQVYNIIEGMCQKRNQDTEKMAVASYISVPASHSSGLEAVSLLHTGLNQCSLLQAKDFNMM
jgi:hypothetical protein